ncbi:hypothetical protein RUM43_001116 [Polyplax serrata]|uniref:Uncharacterized protein n=1 Tax=Polyplax serrata TaxID=468196 RepID=A0AAN8XP58_POLSC
MSLCHKCSDLVQSAAKENIMKKRKEIQRKYGVNSPEAKEKILTDPFVVMWVPGPPEPVGPKPKFYPPDPCCAEYDLSINMSNGTGILEPRLYPIPKHLRWKGTGIGGVAGEDDDDDDDDDDSIGDTRIGYKRRFYYFPSLLRYPRKWKNIFIHIYSHDSKSRRIS